MTCMNNNGGNGGNESGSGGGGSGNGSGDPSSSGWFSFHFTPTPSNEPQHSPPPSPLPEEQVPFPPSSDPHITGQVATEYGEVNYILMDRIRVGLDHQSNVAIIQMERDDQSYANLVLLNPKGVVYLIYNLRMILQDMERLYSYIPPTPQM